MHLLNLFPSVLETDVFLESLWKFFKYRPLAKNLLEESADLYDENVVVQLHHVLQDGLLMSVRANL